MANSKTGVFDRCGDIGSTSEPGRAAYDADTQSYELSGGGLGLRGSRDALHYASLRMQGDFLLTVEGGFPVGGADPRCAWGIMLRGSRADDSAFAAAAIGGDGSTRLSWRPKSGAEAREVKAGVAASDIVQLERQGGSVLLRAAREGEALVELARIAVDLSQELEAGIFVCSGEAASVAAARFRNLRIDVPAAEGVDGDLVPSASRLELLDVETGLRRVVYTSRAHFEAPNWSRDGSFLLYNQDGLIYKFPLASGRPSLLDTGAVKANNNDHGISFDGQWLALSSHTAQVGAKAGSQVYVVGIEGGEPRQVTREAPSYWHGWSPDGASLVYCAERRGNYDVYSIPASGGAETRLTTDPGLDDGPEFSPEGDFVYFNSTRSGRMKIWRMKPDGSGQEQISFDDCNDWFAHVSPDGSSLLYVSYPSSVPAALHPRNQRVMIRQQDLRSGKLRVLAQLYGGQGTMNVPSWSPDGKRVAFVSYTYGDPAI